MAAKIEQSIHGAWFVDGWDLGKTIYATREEAIEGLRSAVLEVFELRAKKAREIAEEIRDMTPQEFASQGMTADRYQP